MILLEDDATLYVVTVGAGLTVNEDWICCALCDPIFKIFWLGTTASDLLLCIGAICAWVAVPEAIT